MILFLDIDGVLHPFFPRADLPDEEKPTFFLSATPRICHQGISLTTNSDRQRLAQ